MGAFSVVARHLDLSSECNLGKTYLTCNQVKELVAGVNYRAARFMLQ